jgi:hypothetical protein
MMADSPYPCLAPARQFIRKTPGHGDKFGITGEVVMPCSARTASPPAGRRRRSHGVARGPPGFFSDEQGCFGDEQGFFGDEAQGLVEFIF